MLDYKKVKIVRKPIQVKLSNDWSSFIFIYDITNPGMETNVFGVVIDYQTLLQIKPEILKYNYQFRTEPRKGSSGFRPGELHGTVTGSQLWSFIDHQLRDTSRDEDTTIKFENDINDCFGFEIIPGYQGMYSAWVDVHDLVDKCQYYNRMTWKFMIDFLRLKTV